MVWTVPGLPDIPLIGNIFRIMALKMICTGTHGNHQQVLALTNLRFHSKTKTPKHHRKEVDYETALSRQSFLEPDSRNSGDTKCNAFSS